jgi:hypothetical protein
MSCIFCKSDDHNSLLSCLQSLKDRDQLKDCRPEICLIQKFFAEEAKKPAPLRKNYCYISCRCARCNPARL